MAEYSPGLAGFESGVNLMRARSERDLRMQELKSQAAIRRIHEENAAKALSLKIQENSIQNQFRAEMATALQAVNDATASEIMVPMQGQEGIGDMAPPLAPMKNPSPMRRIDAMTRFVLPVVGKYAPDKAVPFVNDLLLNEVRTREFEAGPAPTANFKDAQVITGFRQRIAGEKDPTRKVELQQQLDDFLSLAMPAGTSMETTSPDGTTTRITTGRRPATNPGGLTTAATTDLQKKTVAVDNSLATAVNALDTIRKNPAAIGPVGIGREVIEKGQGMIGMQGAAPISKARHQLALDFTQLAEGLRVDTGNMSLYERKQLEKVGDVTKAFETAQTAEDAMENIVKTLVGQKLRLFKAQNKLPDDETIALISFEEIPKLRAAGLLTDAEALHWRDLKRR